MPFNSSVNFLVSLPPFISRLFRVLRYLKGSLGWGLFFPRKSPIQLKGFSDVDWGGCPDSRQSISGYCFYLGVLLVSWRSKKQVTVARSSSEAEYRALAAATCELQWLHYLLTYLQVQPICQSVLYSGQSEGSQYCSQSLVP
ncbi:copia protein [Trifolium medium]|uniref:Copia protein n=1 Tax=Trifolium medium TaxID=97028 RepID=A0A392P300_9FABA|nr:copia protein [Trifolium medium]